MKVNWITFMVKDINESKKFYERFLGLKLAREFSPNEMMKIAFYKANSGSEIELIETKGSGETTETNGRVSLGISVDNYDELLQKARDLKIITQEPQLLGEMECFFVTDPDGIGIQLIKEV